MQSISTAIPETSNTSQNTEQPYRVVKPGRSGSLFNFHEVWLYRDLIMALAMRDLKLRYRQTLLGAIWVVIQPLMGAGIFSFIFNGLAKLPTDGDLPPFVYTFSGMLIYTVFSSVIGRTSNIMVANSALISKVYFPRICLPLSVIPSVLVDLGVSLLVLFALMLYYGVAFGVGVVLWPLAIAFVMILGLGIGLTSASLSVTYRDIQYILPVVVTLMMYASPIAYSTSVVQSSTVSGTAKFLYFLNPLVELISTSRYLLMGQGSLNPLGIGISAFICLLFALLGLSSFRALERKFADVI